LAETEYQNEAVLFSGSVLFLASDRLNLNLSGNYVDSKGTLKTGEMPPVLQEVTDNIAAADYDFSSINQYSDLAYAQFDVSVGAEYALSSRVSLTADATYIDLTDDQGYVYGIESGSFYVVRTGVRIGF
jgi:predicted porin